MKQEHLLLCLLTALLTAPFVGASPQAVTINVEVIATFDYPGSGSTLAYAINNNNVIAGLSDFGGFTRSADGQFSEPLVDMGIAAWAHGLNDSGTVCGYFIGSDTYHGFFLSDGTYTTYDVPGHPGTYVNGINNAGDFVGAYDFFTGFTSIGGKVQAIDIPGGTYITPHGLNSLNQVVGLYSSNLGYAFYSDTSGQLHYPISAPRSHNTFLYGINDQGWMVGGYAGQIGHNRVTHGLLFIAPNKFVTVDYAGSAAVVLTGINNKGFICGYYVDSNNIFHGLIAQARSTAE